jgi:hypothetical protein
MMFWPAVVTGLQRRSWAAQLEARAPKTGTVAGAAEILGVDPELFAAFLRQRLELEVESSSEISRDELIRRLRGSR